MHLPRSVSPRVFIWLADSVGMRTRCPRTLAQRQGQGEGFAHAALTLASQCLLSTEPSSVAHFPWYACHCHTGQLQTLWGL